MAVSEVKIGTAEAFRKAINDNFNALDASISNLKSEVGESLQEDIGALEDKIEVLEGGMKIYVSGTTPPASANMKANDIWFKVI